MNADRMLAHYNRIADSPDAIARLRRFIFDLAVRGKLVPQDASDEPASALLKRIAAEKARLVKAGEIRNDKPLPDLELDEMPYDVPRGWEWVRIRKITSDRGQTVPEREFTYIDVTAINKEAGRIEDAKVTSASAAPSRARKIVRKGDVLYACVRPYLLNIAVVENDISPLPIASTAFAVLNGFGLVLPKYQWIVLRSPFMVACVEEKMRGQAYPAINDSDFALLPFPLPPVTEQRRIVAKVVELMALCDRLEAARSEREATRDRLTTASLARVNTPNPDSEIFADHIRFVLGNLAALTTCPDHIKQLRQSILILAVRGKLIPQDPNDEPASHLLARFAASKARNSVGRDWTQGLSNSKDQAFPLPEGWVWARIADTAERVTVGYVGPMKDRYVRTGIPFLRSQNVRANQFREEGLIYISPQFHQTIIKSALAPGDVVVVRSGNVGTACVIPRTIPRANCSDLVVVQKPSQRYLKFCEAIAASGDLLRRLRA